MAKTVTTVLLLLLFFFFLLLSPSTAKIKSLTIDSDTRSIILFEKFGFTRSGHVTVSLSSVSVLSRNQQQPPPNFSLFGFFLLNEEFLFQVLIEMQQTPNVCVLNSRYVTTLFTFRQISLPLSSPFNRSFPVLSPNEHSLYFANCAPNTSVFMNVRADVYNLDADGSKDFLSVGQTQLPYMFFLFALAYLVFLAIWTYVCRTNRLSFCAIHLLMGTLLLMKALNLICAAEEAQYVKITGKPHGWDVLLYIFQFIRVILLFTVIVLIGTGWPFLKPFLKERGKKVLMVVIPLQVLANVASVVIGETGPFMKDWVTWNQVFLVVDVICCCAIILPIVWSIREASKTDGNSAKLQLFGYFYNAVIGYLFFTRIVVFVLKTIVPYRYQWVSNFAEEAASFVFYVVMFYMFRPVESNEYFVLDEEEEEAARKALGDEEFGLSK